MKFRNMRNIVKNYDSEEILDLYNQYCQNVVMLSLNISPSIHILDCCTKIQVNLNNSNYEKSEVISYDGEPIRGYKLGTLRGLMDDSGVIEQIVFGSIKTHDLELFGHANANKGILTKLGGNLKIKLRIKKNPSTSISGGRVQMCLLVKNRNVFIQKKIQY